MKLRLIQFFHSSEALALLAGAIVLLVPLLPTGRSQWIASGIAFLASGILAYLLFRMRLRTDLAAELEVHDARRHRNHQLRESTEILAKLNEMLVRQASTFSHMTADRTEEFKRWSLPLRVTLLAHRLFGFVSTRFHYEPIPNITVGHISDFEKHRNDESLSAWSTYRRETRRLLQEQFAPEVRELADEMRRDTSSPIIHDQLNELLTLVAPENAALDVGMMAIQTLMKLADHFPVKP